ncbi:MAG: glyceraldehyde-3-phosphate dehydrogenase [Bacteroidia bacterium]
MPLSFLVFILVISNSLFAQKQKLSLKDTLDQKLDCSDYLVHLKGFIPVPMVISEPALGNFGGALGLLFISPDKNIKDSTRFHFPNITGIAGFYTLNNSWGFGGLRQGSLSSIGMRYTAALFYADINLNFYRDAISHDEQEFEFNLKPIFVLTDVSKNILKNKFFLGTRYLFSNMKLAYDLTHINDSVFNVGDYKQDVGTWGLYTEFDNRNSIFTPDHGFRVKAIGSVSRSWTGSDFDFEKFELFAHAFFQPVKQWIIGLRAETQMMNEGAPFYYYPYLQMRGIPVMRYQGNTTLLFETEHRVDFTNRWSVVGFAGTGRTFSDSRYLKNDKWHWCGGAGFRYLIARVFKLRTGIDIAAGPNQFAYYIVFGHYWAR